MRALLVGFFSTFGDLEVLAEVRRVLAAEGMAYDVGSYSTRLSAQLDSGVNIYTVDPQAYSHLLVVCGPFDRDLLARRGVDLDRFAHCVRVGVNLSMIADLETYNPLDAMVGRDSNQWSLPDVSFLYRVGRRPLAGLCLAGPQQEYKSHQQHEQAEDMLRRLISRAGMATLELDTQWPPAHNRAAIATSEDFESIVARLDVMLTTRLHGTVLSLKNGVPVIALDSVAGGGKVSQQAREIGWPECFTVDAVDDAALDQALARCLSPQARQKAIEVTAAASARLSDFPAKLMAAMAAVPSGRPTGTEARKLSRRLANAADRAWARIRRRRA